MRLTDILKETIIHNASNRLVEVSEKVIAILLDKFKKETNDSEETIIKYINSFERYKNGLPVDQRDITRYSYDELKDLIDSKGRVKTMKDAFKLIKKRSRGVSNDLINIALKKFVDILKFLPVEERDISNYNYESLSKLLYNEYDNIMDREIVAHFTRKSNVSNDEVKQYLNEYKNYLNTNRIPVSSKPLTLMSFDDLEHLIDGLNAEYGEVGSKSQYEDNINQSDVIYNENGLKIVKATDKPACIRNAYGRSWCISRSDSGNAFYNYRLRNNLTIYFVIDEDLDFNDLNFGLVVLVSEDGRYRLADRSNSGRYAGSTEIPWKEIVSKQPKLKDLKNYFAWEPMNDDLKKIYDEYSNKRIESDDIISELGSEKNAGIWLEIKSPDFTTYSNGVSIYTNLTDSLKKKYISLGGNLSKSMIDNSSDSIKSYYLNKIYQSNKDKFGNFDILSVNVNLFDSILYLEKYKKDANIGKNIEMFKEQLKNSRNKIIDIIVSNRKLDLSETKVSSDQESITYKVFRILGFNGLLEYIEPKLDTLSEINIKLPTKLLGGFIDIPEIIGNATNLTALSLDGFVNSLPKSIVNLQKLEVLDLSNSNLVELPKSISTLKKLDILILRGVKAFEDTEPEGFIRIVDNTYIPIDKY